MSIWTERMQAESPNFQWDGGKHAADKDLENWDWAPTQADKDQADCALALADVFNVPGQTYGEAAVAREQIEVRMINLLTTCGVRVYDWDDFAFENGHSCGKSVEYTCACGARMCATCHTGHADNCNGKREMA